MAVSLAVSEIVESNCIAATENVFFCLYNDNSCNKHDYAIYKDPSNIQLTCSYNGVQQRKTATEIHGTVIDNLLNS